MLKENVKFGATKDAVAAIKICRFKIFKKVLTCECWDQCELELHLPLELQQVQASFGFGGACG